MTAVREAVPDTATLDTLAGLQDERGCFGSTIHHHDGRVTPDRNAFVTALVLRTTRDVPPTAAWRDATGRALDWLERCRVDAPPGAFRFWPAATRPAWAAAVPPDADDTAVITVELLRHGRTDRARALRTVCLALLPHRVGGAEGPSWVAPGSFRTWLAPGPANVVDCCVNANVAALLARLDATHLPGYDAAVATIHRGLEWAGDDPVRRSALTPFYLDPAALADALAHAVECGAETLGAAAPVSPVPVPTGSGPPGWFRAAYARTVWRAPALDLARAVADLHAKGARRVPDR